ncbi:glycosyltransferase [Gemella sp. GH3]|uniref:glycosyltransferase n=1 Tax=unclassified Gemella TaxID=2624949 RepID=UPI0015D09A9A|nr:MULTISPECIES: glycosyltransferase [unclassified Gemella]MBF0713643.1 glycosyltransferase [Gemella sp. GH3.1]NYS50595.1 glycosyltransferase [Gemella sp. GH3]
MDKAIVNNELISIVVPVYNVSDYLERCVDSLINQNYSNLEIILVDDGSTDNSGDLCDEFAKKDSRIVVYHKENGGLSDARNYGVMKANGDYIGFVDSDDYVNYNMYNHLYNVAKETDADIVECNVVRVYANGHTRSHYKGPEYKEIIDTKQYLKEILSMDRVYGSVWCKLIKSPLAKQLKFSLGKYYEDLFYNYDLFNLDNLKIAITSGSYYYYYIRENSITTENFNSKHMDMLEIMNLIHVFTLENYPEYEEIAFVRLTFAYLSIFNKLIMVDKYKDFSEYREIVKFFKNNKYKIIKCKKASRSLKLAVILLLLNKNMYKKVLVHYKKKEILNK